MSDPESALGLDCPSGGSFYICAGNATEFIGCCTSDPCADDSGDCPTGDLRASSFSNDSYASVPEQSCDEARGSRVWYTCRDNDPPFMGCCANNPCGDGCSRDDLIAAVLTDDEDGRLAFVPEEADDDDDDDGTTSSSPSPTPTPSPSATSEPGEGESADVGDGDDDGDGGGGGGGLSSGAIAGISIGSILAVAILLVLVWKHGWMAALKRKSKGKREGGGFADDDDGNGAPGGQPPEMQHMYNGYPSHEHAQDPVRDSRHTYATATTVGPVSAYNSTPVSPDLSKAGTHSPGHPPSIYTSPSPYGSPYPEQNAVMAGHHHARHSSHHSQISTGAVSYDGNLATVSEIDGVERQAPPPAELPADDQAPGQQRLSTTPA